jgi:hypothetical protein
MRQNFPDWELTTVTNKYVLFFLPIVVLTGSFIILVWGAKPHSTGTIPRFWWPLIFFFIEAGSLLYWAAMMVTRVKYRDRGTEKTVGSKIGFEVKIYNESDPAVPLDLVEAMAQSRLDGSRRRVVYEVSGPLARLGSYYHAVRDFVGKFVF